MKNYSLNFFKNLSFVFATFLLVIFEQIFLPSVNIFFLGQWPIFVLIFALNFFKPRNFSLGLALLAGLLVDFVSGNAFGVFSIIFFLLAIIVQTIGSRLQKNIVSFGLSLIFSVLFFYLATRYLPLLINLI